MRHSTVIHLLHARVDHTTISNWLGHASILTTNRHATVAHSMLRYAPVQVRRSQPE
jgi:site-specific recombinase XerD